MKFPYLKLLLDHRSALFGSSIPKSIIPVKISYKNNTVKYAALIDSGADFCIFDAEVGEYIGLDIKSGQKEMFGGIQESGGAAVAFIHEIILSVGGRDYKTKVGFSYDIAKHGFGVLGQKGFFDIFAVKFDLLKEEIELQEKRNT